MDPVAARASYRDAFTAAAVSVTLARGGSSATVLARLVDWTAEELQAGIMQGRQKVLLLAEDLETASFPVPPKKGDTLTVAGRKLAVDAVDPKTRAIAGLVMAWPVICLGA